MTIEELRMMDREVAEKVFGARFDGDTITDGKQCWPIPNYFTEIAAAWLVVDKLAEKKISLVLEDWRAVEGAPGKWSAIFDLPDGHDTGNGLGETAAEAICNAALKIPERYL
jgi:hypothetical protein